METHSTLMTDIMEEMHPEILAFIRRYVTSFVRWDLIKFFCENPHTRDTAGNLAIYIGRQPKRVQAALDSMVKDGLLRRIRRGEMVVYALTNDRGKLALMTRLTEAARERTFRMKLVYHILRAGGERQ